MENKNNFIPYANANANADKIRIDPIPRILRIYGFLFMIVIFCIVLVLANMINIPMSYNGIIKENNKNMLFIKLYDMHKSEFLPEQGDLIKLTYLATGEEIGKYYIDHVSTKDSTLAVQFNNSMPEDFNNMKVKLLSKNKTLFNLVFERFYK